MSPHVKPEHSGGANPRPPAAPHNQGGGFAHLIDLADSDDDDGDDDEYDDQDGDVPRRPSKMVRTGAA